MTVVDIVIFIGSFLFAVSGLVKMIKPNFRIRGQTLPCGIPMFILGMGLALIAIGV
jgi:hypothetical protein